VVSVRVVAPQRQANGQFDLFNTTLGVPRSTVGLAVEAPKEKVLPTLLFVIPGPKKTKEVPFTAFDLNEAEGTRTDNLEPVNFIAEIVRSDDRCAITVLGKDRELISRCDIVISTEVNELDEDQDMTIYSKVGSWATTFVSPSSNRVSFPNSIQLKQ
jgi:hypothetical protein